MKCPHCNYVTGEFDFENDTFFVGGKGDFYHLPVDLTRSIEIYPYAETRGVVGCPNCDKVFMGD